MPLLPGQWIKLTTTEIDQCDDCEKRATWKLVGETDSFGSEFFYYCETHKAVEKDRLEKADKSGYCSRCQTLSDEVTPTRDFEEGNNGPVYELCNDCLAQDRKRLAQELGDDEEPACFFD